jgi:hypothetical protein
VTNSAAAVEACPDCGTLQRLPETLRADTLSCVGCGTLMQRRQGKSQAAALACAAATLLLLARSLKPPIPGDFQDEATCSVALEKGAILKTMSRNMSLDRRPWG